MISNVSSNKLKIKPTDLVNIGFRPESNSIDDMPNVSFYLLDGNRYTCVAWFKYDFLTLIHWHDQKIHQSVSLEHVLEVCDDGLRDIILFNLDLFR